jgi:hypothetical protein
MVERAHMLLSDHLLDALASINRAREASRSETLQRRETVAFELASAETSIGRVIHLIAHDPPSP